MSGATNSSATGVPARQHQRHLATPVRQLEIVRLLDRRPGADLRRRLGDREPDHPSRAQLGIARSATVVGPARQVVVDDGAQRAVLLVRVVDQDCLPDDGHRAVVHRMVEGRAREHERVDDRDRDADVVHRPRAGATSRCRRRRAGTGDRRPVRTPSATRTRLRRRRNPHGRRCRHRASRQRFPSRTARAPPCAEPSYVGSVPVRTRRFSIPPSSESASRAASIPSSFRNAVPDSRRATARLRARA